MRLRWTWFLVPMVVAVPALASMGGGSRPEPPTTSSSSPPSGSASESDDSSSPRKQAEREYANAYEQVGKGNADLANSKTKDAQKKFKKALESAQQAVSLDPKYHEAWNLVGYTSRKLGDYDGALRAYASCLDIKPDYAPAREYLGEAYIELGQIDKAREQLVMLDHQEATEEAKTLKSKIDAWTSAHPDSSASKPAAGAGQ
jgi:tetratricopeptide (TPR) repeat protein